MIINNGILGKTMCKKRFIFTILFYALIICNHGSPSLGNSRDFDFWSSKCPLKAQTTHYFSKTTTVFPSSLLSFHFTAFFAYIKQTLGNCRGKTFDQSPAHQNQVSLFIKRQTDNTTPGGWGPGDGLDRREWGSWLQMTTV